MEELRLKKKYDVTHTDGSPTDPDAIYFVLRIDKGPLVEACRAAVLAFAENLPPEQDQFAVDIFEMMKDIKAGRHNKLIETP